MGDGVPHWVTKRMLRRSVQAPLHLTICLNYRFPERLSDDVDTQVLEAELHRVVRLNLRIRYLAVECSEPTYDFHNLEELTVESPEHLFIFFIPESPRW